MRKLNHTVLAALFVLLGACSRPQYMFTDFENTLDGADNSAFHVTATNVTDLSSSIPQNCHIPDRKSVV